MFCLNHNQLIDIYTAIDSRKPLNLIFALHVFHLFRSKPWKSSANWQIQTAISHCIVNDDITSISQILMKYFAVLTVASYLCMSVHMDDLAFAVAIACSSLINYNNGLDGLYWCCTTIHSCYILILCIYVSVCVFLCVCLCVIVIVIHTITVILT